MKNSDIFKQKTKFFIIRLVTYFSFLIVPLVLQFAATKNLLIQSILLIFYMMFMLGQWYLLGKEIDYRLKIYYRVNSSQERLLYRLVMGSTVFVVIFNLISFLPHQIINYLYWLFFILIGLFYSWPTRGKIIEESMSNQFYELKFLDSFEKTILILTLLIFIFSFPEIPFFQNIDALKLYFDPFEKIHSAVWNFLTITYYPFVNNSKLFNLVWSYHFYFFGLGGYILAIYVMLRYFVSRRLAILGVFSVVSAWSFAKIVEDNFITSISSTYFIIWMWAIIWSSRSSSYRTGLFVGLVNFAGVLLNMKTIFLMPASLALTWFSITGHTKWYRQQWLKYTFLGGFLAIVASFGHVEINQFFEGISFQNMGSEWLGLLKRKSFFWLSFLGLLLIFLSACFPKLKLKMDLHLNFADMKTLSFSLIFLIFYALILDQSYFSSYGPLWIIASLSLIPLEWLFQSITKLRSKRNIIYAVYILICLLDSHLEGRIRTFFKLFLDQEVLKHINQF